MEPKLIPNAKALLNEKEAATFYGASVKTLQAWRFKGKGPHYYKIGGFIRYSMDDLIKYAEQRKVTI